MQIKTVLTEQLQQLRGLGRNAWLFLSITFTFSIFFATWDLFFNFFILARGFDRQFLGLLRGATPAAALFFGLAMGLVSDRIGRKRAMLFGQIGFLTGFLVALITANPLVILIALFLGGASDSLFAVSEMPLLARLSGDKQKSFLFSLNFGIAVFAGIFGNFIAGRVPAWLETGLGIEMGSVLSYRIILIGAVAVAYLTILPLLLIRLPDHIDKNAEEIHPESGERVRGRTRLMRVLSTPQTWQFFIPNLMIGFGASLLVPFFNLFLVDKFAITELTLGTLFSIASLLTGVGSLLGPSLERALGSRVRAVVAAQFTSLFFLLVLGFAPTLGLATLGFVMRGALMNMGHPLWNSFIMDQVAVTRQATISSLLFVSWEVGWTFGPYISGVVQESMGFAPLFVVTAILYAAATGLQWKFFAGVEEHSAAEPDAALSPAN